MGSAASAVASGITDLRVEAGRAINIRRRHRNLVRTIRQQYGYEPERMKSVQQEHAAIVDAIAAGDVPEAERAARLHVVRSYEDIMLRFRSYLSQKAP